jgi:hypothetical protein
MLCLYVERCVLRSDPRHNLSMTGLRYMSRRASSLVRTTLGSEFCARLACIAKVCKRAQGNACARRVVLQKAPRPHARVTVWIHLSLSLKAMWNESNVEFFYAYLRSRPFRLRIAVCASLGRGWLMQSVRTTSKAPHLYLLLVGRAVKRCE